MTPDQGELDFGPPEPDWPAQPVGRKVGLNHELLARMLAAFERVPVPRKKLPYLLNVGSGWSNPDWIWEWRCPCCKYRRRNRDKAALEAEIQHHRCKPRESANWHPRYRMPPRW